MAMINFDNAATTFPKPYSVKNAVLSYFTKFGGNPGRSGHILSINTAKAIYTVREKCADFFGAEPENIVFTENCTQALNIAIKSVIQEGDHVITSDLEHNSVIRPIHALSKENICTYSVAHVDANPSVTVENFEELIKDNTRAIICTCASNVTGQMLPLSKLSKLCRDYNLCFIVDGAQGAGVIPVKLSDGINIICVPGHKGLYGPTGTGILITDGKYPLSSLMEGGTGSNSLDLDQPDFLPDQQEAGTINTMGILGLGAGIDFVNQKSIYNIFTHESSLCDQFISGMKKISCAVVYRNESASYVPIVSFNINGLNANETAQILSDDGFCLRGGLHCSGLAHNALGTAPEGTVRFAPSVFSTEEQVDRLLIALKKIS